MGQPIPRLNPIFPGFNTPTVKPAGKLEIDWSNPMTRGLLHFWVADSGTKKIYDVNTGLVLDNEDGTAANMTPGANWKGNYVQSSGGTTDIMWGLIPQRTLDRFTIGFAGTFDNTAESDKDMIALGLGADRFIRVGNTSTNVRVTWRGPTNDAAITTTDTPLSDGSFHVISLAGEIYTNPTKNMRLVIDGVFSSVTSGGLGEVFVGDRIGIFGIRRTSNSNQAEGKFYAGWLFNRNLSDAENELLTQNPYQLLKPAEPTIYFPNLSINPIVIEVLPGGTPY